MDRGSKAVSKEQLNNLIVNFLPLHLAEWELCKLFGTVGPIYSVRIMRDTKTSKSKGYGFVKFVFHKHAKKAIEQFNGMKLCGKLIKVTFSRPGGSRNGCNLFVSNLPKYWNDDDLYDLFKRFGELLECRILKNSQGNSRRCGFVRFNHCSEAQEAILNLDGWFGENCRAPIHVKLAEKRVHDDRTKKISAKLMLKSTTHSRQHTSRKAFSAEQSPQSKYASYGLPTPEMYRQMMNFNHPKEHAKQIRSGGALMPEQTSDLHIKAMSENVQISYPAPDVQDHTADWHKTNSKLDTSIQNAKTLLSVGTQTPNPSELGRGSLQSHSFVVQRTPPPPSLYQDLPTTGAPIATPSPPFPSMPSTGVQLTPPPLYPMTGSPFLSFPQVPSKFDSLTPSPPPPAEKRYKTGEALANRYQVSLVDTYFHVNKQKRGYYPENTASPPSTENKSNEKSSSFDYSASAQHPSMPTDPFIMSKVFSDGQSLPLYSSGIWS